jgi:hypothetical protein
VDSPIEFKDLAVFDDQLSKAAAEAMIATVWSRTRKLAPCLKEDDVELDVDDLETVKGIVRSVILRWAESGSGVVGSRNAGDYGETYTTGGGGSFRPDEVRDLQTVCAGVRRGQRAYAVVTGPSTTRVVQHASWCNINFGETILCDCGAELTADGTPLWSR